ncbi:MAG: helix-turn-helix domain-containing protein [Solirubrobacteraceae bacterium]
MADNTEPLRPRLTGEDVLDARQLADLLHLPSSTVLDLARRGILPAHKLGRRWIFLHDEIETHIRAAPARSDMRSREQPPVQRAGDTARHRPKRYPEAVPATPTTGQSQLFA